MLIYAFVARDDGTVLAEHAGAKTNASQVAATCLQHAMRTPDVRTTIACDKHTFNFFKSGRWIYLAVADEAFGRQVPFAYLERIAEAWEWEYAARAERSAARSFNRAFGPRLKEQMDYLNANPESINRVAAVQRKVDETMAVMVQNIDKVVARGNRLELLVEATEDLQEAAQQFQKQGRRLRQEFWCQGVKVKIAIFSSIFLIIAFVVVFVACFGGANRCVPKRGGADSGGQRRM